MKSIWNFIFILLNTLFATSCADEIDPFPLQLMNSMNITTSYVNRFYATRLLLEEKTKDPYHVKTWRNLPEIDGIRNEEVAVFIISSNGQHERLLWERVIPSTRTWMKGFAKVFVIVEDTFMMRYALRHCKHHDWKKYTTFDCHNEASYLLTRICTDQYYVADGPCCKVDAMIDYLTNENIELLNQIKYVFQGDDDTYFRGDQLMKWVAAVEKSGIGHFPIVGSMAPTKEDHGVWHIKNCQEIRATGWYQPVMFNRAALKKMTIASAAYGLRETCRNFDLSQDVGIEVYVWLFGLYHIYIPLGTVNGEHKGSEVFKPNLMIIHGLKNDKDHCQHHEQHSWPDKDKYDQRMVIGCGDIDHHSTFHDPIKEASMYDAFEYYRDHGEELQFGKEGEYEWKKTKVTIFPRTSESEKVKVKEILSPNAKIENDQYNGDPVMELVLPTLQYIDGYEKTKHSKENDIVNKEWKGFKLTDCNPPGKVG